MKIIAALAASLLATTATAAVIPYKLTGHVADGRAFVATVTADAWIFVLDNYTYVSGAGEAPFGFHTATVSFADGPVTDTFNADITSRYNDSIFVANTSLGATFSSSANPFNAANIATGYTYTLQPGDTGSGYIFYAVGQSSDTYPNGIVKRLNTTFTIDAIGVNVLQAVPEPASWAMLIAGFGLAGAGLRRRPRATSIA